MLNISRGDFAVRKISATARYDDWLVTQHTLSYLSDTDMGSNPVAGGGCWSCNWLIPNPETRATIYIYDSET